MKLISSGNSKLKIHSPKRWNRWPRANARRRKTRVFSTSLPALHTCPGKSAYVDEKNGVGGYQAKPPKRHGGIQIRRLKSRKGGEMDEWPEDLRIREWPKGRATT